MKKVALILTCVIGWGLSTEATAASSTLLGPTTYTRTSGQPVTYTETFTHCEPQAKYQLVVVNRQEEGYRRISSARILLNGLEVLSPDELNQQVESIPRPVFLQAQNILEIRLASGPGGQITVSIECVANCFEVRITSPVDQSTINRAEMLVSGVISTSAEEAGIVINGVVAQINGDQFAADKIPLGLGRNTLIAVATNTCGQTAQASATVQVDSIEQETHLSAIPTTGIVPLAVIFHLTAVLDHPVTQYQWDLTGDGTIDASGPTLTDVSTTYTYEGLFFPKVILMDDQQNTYTETTVINVISLSQVDSLIRKKWDGMKTALANKDVEGALEFLADGTKGMYRENFTLMKEILPQIVTDMGELRFVRFVRSGAIYEMRGVQDGRELSFHVEFVKDVNGFWKIRFF